MRAGGAGGSTTEAAPAKLVMGGTIAVELIRGDMSAAAFGTVSYIDGDKILAFGHPMFQTGETYAPVATAITHTVIPSSQSAFLLASAGVEVGSLIQDRQAAIMADTSLRTHDDPGRHQIDERERQAQRGRLVPRRAARQQVPDAGDRGRGGDERDQLLPARSRRRHRADRVDRTNQGRRAVDVRRLPLRERRRSFGHGRRARLARARAAACSTRSARSISSASISKIDLKFEANYGELKEVNVPTGELIPGQRNTLHVHLQGFDGKDIDEDLPVDVPESVAGGIVQLEVVRRRRREARRRTAGRSAFADRRVPQAVAGQRVVGDDLSRRRRRRARRQGRPRFAPERARQAASAEPELSARSRIKSARAHAVARAGA